MANNDAQVPAPILEIAQVPAQPVINQYYNTTQDISTFPIGVLLTESNYSSWSHVMYMCIGARNKIGHLTGNTPIPAANTPEYDVWATNDLKVKSWLVENMSPALINRYVRLHTAKDIWDALEATYYDDSDETRLFELNCLCFGAKQNRRPLATYYNELLGWLQEMDQRLSSQITTPEGTIAIAAYVGRQRVHMFLSSLDSEFDQVRGEVLRKDPKLDLAHSYAYVCHFHTDCVTYFEKMEPAVMASTSAPMARTSAIITGHGPSHTSFPPRQPNRFATYVCPLCGETGHTREHCFETIGYPEWWGDRPRKNVTKSTRKDIHTANAVNSGLSDITSHELWC